MRSSFSVLVLLAVLHGTEAACNAPCPYYTLNVSADADPYRFTNILDTDFTRPNASLTWDSSPGLDWQAQAYNVTPSAARGPYGKAAELSNVVLDGETGLQLWVRSKPLIDMIPIAEIATARNDILYGSFRVSMKTTAVNGTCGAFFLYHNDSQEIDMEFLSRQQQREEQVLNLVLQSPASVAAGNNAALTPTFVPEVLFFDPTAEFHEYRFDWMPGSVDMYADGIWLHTFDANHNSSDAVPDSPGALHLIHWSSGDPGWSGRLPAQDAVMEVQWVRAWFNTSRGVEDGEVCVSDAAECQIPATGGPPAPQATPSASGTGSAGAEGTGAPKQSGSDSSPHAPLTMLSAILAFAVLVLAV